MSDFATIITLLETISDEERVALREMLADDSVDWVACGKEIEECRMRVEAEKRRQKDWECLRLEHAAILARRVQSVA